MTEKEFYASPRWLHKRDLILRRDGYRCQICKRYGRIRQATLVHHIEHLDERPDLALASDNLISVCASCHNALHPERARGGRH